MESHTLKIIFFNFNDKLIKQFFEFLKEKSKWNEKKTDSEIFYVQENKIEDKKNDKTYLLYWKSIIYPEISKENNDLILDSLDEQLKKQEEKLIIFLFGKNCLKDDDLNDLIKLENQIGIVTNEKYISHNNYFNLNLTNIKYNKEDSQETINNIFIYLLERDHYFNKRGNLINDILLDFPLNILLTGISRKGKSTFINLLSKKLVAYSNSEFKGVTSKIEPYKIYEQINDKTIGIQLYDTPGFTDDNSNNIEEVIKYIKDKIKEKNDSIEEYHLIYFFLSNAENLDNNKKAFQCLKEINEERENKGF